MRPRCATVLGQCAHGHSRSTNQELVLFGSRVAQYHHYNCQPGSYAHHSLWYHQAIRPCDQASSFEVVNLSCLLDKLCRGYVHPNVTAITHNSSQHYRIYRRSSCGNTSWWLSAAVVSTKPQNYDELRLTALVPTRCR